MVPSDKITIIPGAIASDPGISLLFRQHAKRAQGRSIVAVGVMSFGTRKFRVVGNCDRLPASKEPFVLDDDQCGTDSGGRLPNPGNVSCDVNAVQAHRPCEA